jgi:hypothetical protein
MLKVAFGTASGVMVTGRFSRISKLIQRSNLVTFLFKKAAKKIETISDHIACTDKILKTLKKYVYPFKGLYFIHLVLLKRTPR